MSTSFVFVDLYLWLCICVSVFVYLYLCICWTQFIISHDSRIMDCRVFNVNLFINSENVYPFQRPCICVFVDCCICGFHEVVEVRLVGYQMFIFLGDQQESGAFRCTQLITIVYITQTAYQTNKITWFCVIDHY